MHPFSSTGLLPFLVNLFQDYSTKRCICNFPPGSHPGPIRPRYFHCTTHASYTCSRFGLFPFRSPLLRKSISLSFPRGTEMFHFPRLSLLPYLFRQQYHDITHDRFPHSDTPGLKDVYSYPGLIAVNHVLHRLLMPRHPLCALSNLTILPNISLGVC